MSKNYSHTRIKISNQNHYWVIIRNRIFKTRNISSHWNILYPAFLLTAGAFVVVRALITPIIEFPLVYYLSLIFLLLVCIFIILMQVRSRFYSKLAMNVFESGYLHSVTQAAAHYSDAGEFDIAASLYFSVLRNKNKLDYWEYTRDLSHYLDNINALPRDTKFNRLYTDAIGISDENTLIFLDLYSVYLLLTENITGNSHSANFQNVYLSVRSGTNEVDEKLFLLKSSIIDGVLECNKGNWSEVMKSLMKIRKFDWTYHYTVIDLFNLLLNKSYTLEDPEWFILLSAFRNNTERIIGAYGESLVTPVYNGWGLSGLVSYMNLATSLQTGLNTRYAPPYRILVDVLDLAEKYKLKSFIIENLSLLLGYVGKDSYWHPCTVFESIFFRYFDDHEFSYRLIQEGILIVNRFPELSNSLSSMSKILGMNLRTKDIVKSIQFFETAIDLGLTLADRTIAYTSTTYLIQLYTNYNQSEFMERIEENLVKQNGDQNICSVIMACAISETHEKKWIKNRNVLIDRYESIDNVSSFAEGIINLTKYEIAYEEKNYDLAIDLIDKSASAYFDIARYREAGLRWMHGGVLSWQYGIAKSMRDLLEKALISFEKAEQPWLQVSVFAALNRWTDIAPVMESRMKRVEAEIQRIDEVDNRSHLFSQKDRDEEKEKRKHLLFEKRIILLVVNACECIDGIEGVQFSEALERMNQIEEALKTNIKNIVRTHPAASFVSALGLVVSYYLSLVRAIINRRNGEYEKSTQELETLVHMLNHRLAPIAKVHKPYLRTLRHFAKAQLRLTRALNPDTSDEEKVNAERSAIMDLNSVRTTLEALGMSNEVERINRMLDGTIASSRDATPYEMLLRIPLIPETRIGREDDSVDDGASLSSVARIIHLVLGAGQNMERKIRTFAKLGENEMRDVLIVTLESNEDVIATGETFSKLGKTDIHVQFSKKSRLIIECKIWNGQSKYHDSIDQLFRYLTLRDNEGIILTFCKKGDMTRILEKAKVGIQRNKTYVNDTWLLQDSSGMYATTKHRFPSDSNKIIIIHHIFFALMI